MGIHRITPKGDFKRKRTFDYGRSMEEVVEATWQKLYELNKAVNPDFKHCHLVDMENGTGLELQYYSDSVENSYHCEDIIGLKASTKDAGSIEITIAVGVPADWSTPVPQPPRLLCSFQTLHIMIPFLESLIETQKKNPNRVSSLDMLEYLVTVISGICALARNT